MLRPSFVENKRKVAPRPVSRDGTRDKISKKARPNLIPLLAIALVVFLFLSFQGTQEVALENVHKEDVKAKLVTEPPMRTVQVKSLEHEGAFAATIKSCMPEKNKNCKVFIPEHTTTERVALLAPPGDMADSFFRLLQVVVERAKKKNSAVDMQLIRTSHMAPYGYGKTHGWTRIIRIVPEPLLLGATNTLFGSVRKADDEITVDDIKSSLRQQIRYHCRLSHISAHTSLWSVKLQAIVTLPMKDLVNEIQRFLGLEQIDITAEVEENHETVADDDLIPPKDLEKLTNRLSTAGSSILSRAQTQIQDDILRELDDVLVEELRVSKNLSAWPCESFWSVGDPAKDTATLSPIVSRISKAISPNCTAPFISCFVQRDKCEFKGDARCDG